MDEFHARRLVDLYADTILRISYSYLKQTCDAEDICQTVFLKYLTNDCTFDSICRLYTSRQVRVEQQLDFFQDFYADFDRTRAEEMLSALNISLSAKFKSLSKGNQEKVQLVLVLSLIHI